MLYEEAHKLRAAKPVPDTHKIDANKALPKINFDIFVLLLLAKQSYAFSFAFNRFFLLIIYIFKMFF